MTKNISKGNFAAAFLAALILLLCLLTNGVFCADIGENKDNGFALSEVQLFNALGDPAAPQQKEGVYQIENAAQLGWFRDLVNGTLTDGTPQNTAAKAVLTADIDLSGLCHPANNASSIAELSWEPIGNTAANAFTGEFDGQGYWIRNLYINVTGGSNAGTGFFGINKGTVKGVVIKSGSVTNDNMNLGGIAGKNSGTISQCGNEASITSEKTSVGGIAGAASGGTVDSCYNLGTVTSNWANSANPRLFIGGIVGNGTMGTITNCYNAGSIVSTNNFMYFGGITATMTNMAATVKNCYNVGEIQSTDTRQSCAIAPAGIPTEENNYYVSDGKHTAGIGTQKTA